MSSYRIYTNILMIIELHVDGTLLIATSHKEGKMDPIM